MKVIGSNRVPIKAWIDGVELEDEARNQLMNVAGLPFVFKHVAVMPDVHFGKGATVGSVIATKGAVVPAAVGVDIGCGMVAQKTTLNAKDLPDDLHALRTAIEAAVPHGRTHNGGPNDRGAWNVLPALPSFELTATRLAPGLESIRDLAPRLATHWNDARALRHLGTLGTGNHFIEICLDENEVVWVMLHSGSRGIGNAIGMHFIERATKLAEQYFIALPDKDLAYLPEGTPEFDAYLMAAGWAQDFAQANRDLMLERTLAALEATVGKAVIADGDRAIDCHHNYVARERHFETDVLVTRKGAVRAREGDLGIIPGAMGVPSYIVRGKGNAESFTSCSHGAGRRMSRNEAKRRFSLSDHAAATEGLECRKDADVIDETPGAYKSIRDVIAAQSELIDVCHTLNAVVCVKG
ncbi:MAG TPA: RtcB family protein [Candidatus Baltobacteraceae bacterium]|nr:RtcB family protein [Candidatus Baltobacteraceae bacterium]